MAGYTLKDPLTEEPLSFGTLVWWYGHDGRRRAGHLIDAKFGPRGGLRVAVVRTKRRSGADKDLIFTGHSMRFFKLNPDEWKEHL